MITLPDAEPPVLDTRSPGRLLLALGRVQRRTLMAGALLGVLWMATQAAIPYVVGRTVDAGVVRHDGGALLTGCLVLLALGVATAVAGVMRHRFAVFNWLQGTLRVQQLVGNHVADHGPSVAARTTTGEVIETAGEDSGRIGDLYDISARATGSVVVYLGVSVLLLRTDLVVGLWVIIGLPVLTATLAVVVRPLAARQKKHREKEGELTALGADTVAGLRVLRGIGGEDQFLGRYTARSQEVRRAGERVATPQAALDAAHVLLPGVFVVVLTWLGAHAALAGRLTAGDVVTFYGYAAFLRLPLETATETLAKATRAWVAAKHVTAVVVPVGAGDAASREMPPPGSVVEDPESGLRVLPGLLTGLVGAVPEEVAAVADRLAGLGPDDGRDGALIGGVPVRELPLDAVRERVLVSEAEPRLFSGPLRTGLDPYDRHTDHEILTALEVADAGDVLDALPDGLATEVEERGRSFSGGQRQRLALARAVLTGPEVLVLVEPTSAVDAHTEARVAHRVRAAREGRTTLVASASPLVLQECDRVLFLAGGRVTAEGTHGELLRDHPGYRRVVTRGEDR